MAELGKNVKITLGRAQRDRLSRMLGEVFGCQRATPAEDLDIHTFADGANLGAYVVADEEALSPEQLMRGAWLELTVEDVEAAARALAGLDLRPFEYSDKEHTYFQAPGGQVFRLAPTTTRSNKEQSR